jgi:hypothetical protein
VTVARRTATAALLALALLLAPCVTGAGCGSASPPAATSSPAADGGQPPVDTYVDSQGQSAGSGASATGGDNASDQKSVELVRVSIGAGGKYIGVQFIAPPAVARRWQAGMLWVVDEDSGVRYDKVPMVPVLGELIGRPQTAGQIGYVMLVNKPALRDGDVVTVVLGGFKKGHVVVGRGGM